jgi:hypothetical protein
MLSLPFTSLPGAIFLACIINEIERLEAFFKHSTFSCFNGHSSTMRGKCKRAITLFVLKLVFRKCYGVTSKISLLFLQVFSEIYKHFFNRETLKIRRAAVSS